MGLSRSLEQIAIRAGGKNGRRLESVDVNVLEVRNMLKKREDGAQYELRIPEFSVGAKDIVAVTGPSGCGKSTTLDLLGMALRPDEAECFIINARSGPLDIASFWKGNDTGRLAMARRNNMGYVLQTGELFPFMTVRENTELGALMAGKDRKTASRSAAELMERLKIDHLADVMPGRLSIGERQRAAIARALAPKPLLLLADEPTAALDPLLARSVMKLFLDIIAEFGTSVIMVSHDLNMVHEFGFRECPVHVEKKNNNIVATLGPGV